MAGSASFLWLGVDALLSVFYAGRWTVALTPWLALVCLLHVARVDGPVAGFLWIWFALPIAYGVANRGVIPLPAIPNVVAVVAFAFLPALAFLADRLLAPRWSGFAFTLAFPSAWVALEFASARLSPYGNPDMESLV